MAYVFCDACGIGSHSNVRSCPQCGRRVRRAYEADTLAASRPARERRRSRAPREDVEREVRESIYGWRSGAVEVARGRGR